jgi:hypothetical protein
MGSAGLLVHDRRNIASWHSARVVIPVHAKPSTLVVLAAARPPKLSMLDMDRDIDGTCHRWTLHRQSSQWVGPAEAGCKPPKDLDPGNEARVSRAVYARNIGSNAYTRPSASDSAAVPQAA